MQEPVWMLLRREIFFLSLMVFELQIVICPPWLMFTGIMIL